MFEIDISFWAHDSDPFPTKHPASHCGLFPKPDPHRGTLPASKEMLEHVEVYRAEVVEYENTDRSWIHKYGGRIRGSESLSLSGSLIGTHATSHNRKIMDIIQLKHSGINTRKYRFLPFYGPFYNLVR